MGHCVAGHTRQRRQRTFARYSMPCLWKDMGSFLLEYFRITALLIIISPPALTPRRFERILEPDLQAVDADGAIDKYSGGEAERGHEEK